MKKLLIYLSGLESSNTKIIIYWVFGLFEEILIRISKIISRYAVQISKIYTILVDTLYVFFFFNFALFFFHL